MDSMADPLFSSYSVGQVKTPMGLAHCPNPGTAKKQVLVHYLVWHFLSLQAKNIMIKCL
jgi:hypothetical protein